MSPETTDTSTRSARSAVGGDTRGNRRTIQGTVTSTKMDKTAVVTVIRRVRDRRFHKFVTRRVKYKAHDEQNAAKIGDVVEIIEARPMSRTKRWRIIRTISHNAEIQPGPTEGRDQPVEK
jgi:small subunit ribosomal protein S17